MGGPPWAGPVPTLWLGPLRFGSVTYVSKLLLLGSSNLTLLNGTWQQEHDLSVTQVTASVEGGRGGQIRDDLDSPIAREPRALLSPFHHFAVRFQQ